MRKILEEIKRRNVFKVAFVYVIAGWLTMQIVDVMFPALKLPEWMTSALAAMLLIGFPFALIFAWAFEMTPDGIKREKDVDRSESITTDTGHKLNQSALIILAVAVGFLLVDKFFLQSVPTMQDAQQINDSAAPVAEVAQTVKPSIAVLPFVNMSGDIENEYFSDGLSEELLNVLAKIPQLHVAGRTSSFAFKGKNDDLRAIGEKLNVTNILEGSVRQSNTRLRITAQLIDTENGYHLWSETYDREISDVFAVQDEISAAVVDALKVALLGVQIQTNHGTQNSDAYNLYLKGRYLLEHTSEDNLIRGTKAIDAAIALDPAYANAYVLRAIAEVQSVSGWSSNGSDFSEGFARVRSYAEKAVELDPQSAEARFIQGVVAFSADWDFKAALMHFAAAIKLDPGHVPAMGWYGNTLNALGRVRETVDVYEQALKIDPLSITLIRDLGDAYLFLGDYDRAIDIYNSILSLNDNVTRVYGRLGRAAIFQGDIEAAEQYANMEGTEWVREFLLVLTLGRRGQTDEWRAAVNAYINRYGELNAYQMAEIYGDVGDVEEAFRWLEVARKVHDPGATIARVDGHLLALHDDPRWPEYLRAIGSAD